MNAKISVVIPAYNEQESIEKCINTLKNQSYKPLEIIVVDDGSTDSTLKKVNKFNINVLTQRHVGPGKARNFGAQSSGGEILVFVDSDMYFDKNFIKDLVLPIRQGKSIGTFSKNEMNGNSHKIWSQCWNLNRTGEINHLISRNHPDNSPVYRAILKREFLRVNGFTSTGEYTDDWTLWEKLGKKATLAPGATYYHSNPSTLEEVWGQAQWFATNKYISGDIFRLIKSIIFYSIPISLIIGILKTIQYKKVHFIIFRLWFDFAVFTALLKFPFQKNKAK